jgi:hypothetical protein
MHEDIQAQLSRIENAAHISRPRFKRKCSILKKQQLIWGFRRVTFINSLHREKSNISALKARCYSLTELALINWLQRNRLASITEIEQEAIENAKNCRRK